MIILCDCMIIGKNYQCGLGVPLPFIAINKSSLLFPKELDSQILEMLKSKNQNISRGNLVWHGDGTIQVNKSLLKNCGPSVLRIVPEAGHVLALGYQDQNVYLPTSGHVLIPIGIDAALPTSVYIPGSREVESFLDGANISYDTPNTGQTPADLETAIMMASRGVPFNVLVHLSGGSALHIHSTAAKSPT